MRDDASELSRARRAFHRRLVSTPGVICSLNDEQVDCSLYIEGHVYKVNEATETNFVTLRDLWETPDGWALSEAVDVWRHARELALGFHYIWDPRPPDDWLAKRKAWAKFVRTTLSGSRTLDSEKQVMSACERGDLDDEEFHAWQDIRPTFTINQKAVWHDDSALELCTKWLKKHKGICWTDHTFFGRELARRSGLPYFGQNGLDENGRSLVKWVEEINAGHAKPGPLIASGAANDTGKNLQAWSANLISSCMTGASVWEQRLGRTHRPGQKEDEVTVDVLVGCIEHVDAWERAVAEAKMSRDVLGAPQKILLADIDMPSPHDVSRMSGARWRKTSLDSANTT